MILGAWRWSPQAGAGARNNPVSLPVASLQIAVLVLLPSHRGSVAGEEVHAKPSRMRRLVRARHGGGVADRVRPALVEARRG